VLQGEQELGAWPGTQEDAIIELVPGIAEATDPGEPNGGFQSFVTYGTGPPPPPTAIELELQADRLRFMGLDESLIGGFLTRAQQAYPEAQHWLGERLAELAPPDEPPTCDCGEILVGLNWRGAAIMRCSVCGARWRVEITDTESWSQAAVDGPSAEWVEAHPLQYADAYGQHTPEDVIQHGLPALVSEIDAGTCFPVATWEGDRYGAVLYVCRQEAGEFDFPGDEYENEIEHLVRDGDDWMSTGSGGGGWVNVLDPPRELLDKYVILGTGTSGFSDEDEAMFFTGGLCSSAVSSIATSDLDGVRRVEVDPSRPFFLAGVRGRGHIRLLDRDGTLLRGWTGDALAWDIGDHAW